MYMGHTDDKVVTKDGLLTGVLLAHIEKYYQDKSDHKGKEVKNEDNESKEGEKSGKGSEDGKG